MKPFLQRLEREERDEREDAREDRLLRRAMADALETEERKGGLGATLSAKERRRRVQQLLDTRRGASDNEVEVDAAVDAPRLQRRTEHHAPAGPGAGPGAAGKPRGKKKAWGSNSPRPQSAPRERRAVGHLYGIRRPATPSRHSREAASARVEEELRKSATFKPRLIAEYPRPHLTASGRDRVAELAQPKSIKWRQRELQKRQQDEAEVQKYPFQPGGGKKPGRGRGGPDPGLVDRLSRRSTRVAHRTEILRKELQAKEEAECSFRPQVRAEGMVDLGDRVPIYKRVNAIQQEKQAKLVQLRIAKEIEDPDLTFAPAVNPNSIRLAEARELEEELNLNARIEAGLAASPSRTEVRAHRQAHITEDDLECSFYPQISAESERIIAAAPARETNFIKRQELHRQMTERRKATKVKEYEDPECTFKPTLSTTASQAKTQGEEESPELLDRIHRLAVKDVETFQEKKKELEKDFYQDCTFAPQLKAKGARQGRGSGLRELYHNSKGRVIKEKVKQQAEEDFKQRCTFKPNMDKPRLKSSDADVVPTARFQISNQDAETVVQRIQEYRKEREAQIMARKAELEKNELDKCTFAPKINKKRAKPKQVSIAGLTRHLELRKAAKEKELEKRRIEQKVFMTDVSRLREKKGSTDPKPFRLSNHIASAAKREKVAQALEAERMAECTFQPTTNEARNRDLIRRILEGEDSENFGV